MSQVWVTNMSVTVRFDDHIREYIEDFLKSRKSVWHSSVLDSLSFTLYYGGNQFSQVTVIDPDEIILDGVWDLVDLSWGDLDPENACVLLKSQDVHKTVEFTFPSEYNIAFEKAMYYHIGKFLTKRAKSLLETDEVFLLWDGFRIIYVEDESVLCLQFQSETKELSIEVDGEFPFIGKKGFVVMGDVMFYIPPQRRN